MRVLLAVLGFELGYHRDLSDAATRGFSRDARRLINNANLSVDVRTAIDVVLRRTASPYFEQHFDDCFDLGDHVRRWQDTVARLCGSTELGSTRSATRDLARRLGRAHHSGQDYYAHSNHVELLSLSSDPFEPATHDEVLHEPRFESVRDRWRTSGLMSGAYFDAPPEIGSMELHHRTLNKDKPRIRGDYIYADRLDRTDMHHRARECAARESLRLNDIAAKHQPEAYAGLAAYRSGLVERVAEALKYLLTWAAAAVSGHWR